MSSTASESVPSVPMEYLMKLYEARQKQNARKAEWAKTEEGKAYNRKKAKEYYERNKDKVLEKRKARYDTDRDTLLNRAKDYYHRVVKEAV